MTIARPLHRRPKALSSSTRLRRPDEEIESDSRRVDVRGRPGRGRAARRRAPRKRAARAPAHPKPIPVKPVVENPVADLPFPKFDRGPQVASACTTGLEGAMLRVKELEKRKPGADWLKGWEALYDWEEDQSGALDLPAERASERRGARGGREVRAALERLPGRRWA